METKPLLNFDSEKKMDVRHLLSDKYFLWALPITVFQIFMSGMGIFGNTVLLIICVRRKVKNSAMFYIGSLAVVDMFACVVVIPLQVVHSRRYYTFNNETACKLFHWFKMSTLASSCLLFMAIAVDRYKAICTPLTWRSSGRKSAMVIATTCILTGAVFMSPEMVLTGVQKYSVNRTIWQYDFQPEILALADLNQSCHICEHLNEFSQTWELKTFFSIALAIFIVLVAVAIVCYSRIVKTIHKTRKNLSEASVNRNYRAQMIPLREIKSCSKDVTSSSDQEANLKGDKDSDSVYGSSDGVSEKRSSLTVDRTLGRGDNGLYFKSKTRSMTSIPENSKKEWRSALNSSKQIDVSKALMAVTGVFLLTWLPYWVIGIYGLNVPDYHITSSPEVVITLDFLQQLFFLNNAINPLVYILYSGEFRHHCKQILNTCLRRRPKS